MGQLEKYGLYVLCLVIFLILGVTIWGEPQGTRPDRGNSAAAMNATGSPTGVSPAGGSPSGKPAAANQVPGNQALGNRAAGDQVAGAGVPSDGLGGGRSLDSLLGPASGAARAIEASGDKSGAKAIGADGPGKGAAEPKGNGPQDAVAQGAKTKAYKVQKGDSFDLIARRELGSASRVAEIVTLNPDVDPRKLQLNQTILLPNGSATAGATPVELPAPALAKDALSGGEALRRAGAFRIYTVAKGDTLDRIARVELGSSSRVSDMKDLNPGLDPRKLQIGQKIKLPTQ